MYVDANLLIGMKIGFMLGLCTVFFFWLAWKIFERYSTQNHTELKAWFKKEVEKH